jgi:hypothetical protein
MNSICTCWEGSTRSCIFYLTLSSTRSFFSLSSGLGIASAMLIISNNNVEQHTWPQRVISEIRERNVLLFSSNHLLLHTQYQQPKVKSYKVFMTVVLLSSIALKWINNRALHFWSKYSFLYLHQHQMGPTKFTLITAPEPLNPLPSAASVLLFHFQLIRNHESLNSVTGQPPVGTTDHWRQPQSIPKVLEAKGNAHFMTHYVIFNYEKILPSGQCVFLQLNKCNSTYNIHVKCTGGIISK